MLEPPGNPCSFHPDAKNGRESAGDRGPEYGDQEKENQRDGHQQPEADQQRDQRDTGAHQQAVERADGQERHRQHHGSGRPPPDPNRLVIRTPASGQEMDHRGGCDQADGRGQGQSPGP